VSDLILPALDWRLVRRLSSRGLLIVLAPAVTIFAFSVALSSHSPAIDMHWAYLPAAHEVIHGRSPYHVHSIRSGEAFVYPPLSAFLMVPFTFVPVALADALAMVLALTVPAAVLRLMNITDWRCYLIVYLWAPVMTAVQTANLIIVVALGIAALWRYRDRPVAAGVIAGLLTTLKLFAWPVLLYLVVTRRWRAAAIGAITCVTSLLLPWALIGFRDLTSYPQLLSQLEHAERSHGYTLAALVALDHSWWLAKAITYGVAAAVAAAAYIRRRDDRFVFVAMVSLALLLSPIVWLSYFVLLIPVVALGSRRFGLLWVAPLVFVVAGGISSRPAWHTALGLLIAFGVCFVAARPGRVARRALSPVAP
jgi:alpha-1,2-mannosyltransferase